MHNYLKSSVCNGSCPKALNVETSFFRNELIMRMMEDRSTVRYLCAPAYCGKSTLAAQYAHFIDQFLNTWWINASHACFLRDLDDGTLEAYLTSDLHKHRIVVFEDLPTLSQKRVEVFWEIAQKILIEGGEVLVTSTPGADPLASFRDRCIVLDAKDMLCSSDELMKYDRHGRERVIGLIHATDEVYRNFIVELVRDGQLASVAESFIVYALGRGTYDELYEVTKAGVHPGLAALDSEAFIYRSFEGRRFSTSYLTIDTLAYMYAPYLPKLVDTRGNPFEDSIIVRIADALAHEGNFERACEIIKVFARPLSQMAWLCAWQEKMCDAGCFASPELLYQRIGMMRNNQMTELRIGSSLRRSLLGDKSAVQELLSLSQKGTTTLSYTLKSASAAFVLSACDTIDLCAPTSQAISTLLVYADHEVMPVPSETSALLAFWKHINDADGGFEAVYTFAQRGYVASSCWAFACAIKHAASKVSDQELRCILWKLQTLLKEEEPDKLMRLGRTILQKALQRIPLTAQIGLSLPGDTYCDEIMHTLRAQYESLRVMSRNSLSQGVQKKRVQGCSEESIPRLEVKLLGSFSVERNSFAIDPALFSRQKTRALLALLLLSEGQVLPTDNISFMLWPASSAEKARTNMYCTLSKLKTALKLPDGSCPYLNRSSGFVALSRSLVHCDCDDIKLLCAHMCSGELQIDALIDALKSLSSLYQGEFLPGNDDDEPIIWARRMWQRRVVDAALSSSHQFEQEQKLTWALTAAETALEWDQEREDSYAQIIHLQTCLGQRPSAVQTWFRYVKSMRLIGLDPSQEMSKLYAEVISGTYHRAA